jgi:GNAT superfamily N-acetyltransferase
LTNFSTFTDIEIAEFAVANQYEFGSNGETVDEILGRINDRSAVLEKRSYGFALIELKPAGNGQQISHLWILYVAPERRGKRLGHRFVLELKRKYMKTHHMSLWCYGTRRRAFFGRLGFRIESRDGERRRMTTNPEPNR